jgi:hypothetical protein
MGMMFYEYDPEKHEHFINSKKVPGITGVIDAAGFIPEFAKNEYRAQQGTIGHLMCMMVFCDELEAWDIPESNLKQLEVIKQFKKDFNIVPFEHQGQKICELPMASKLGFAGIPDLLDSERRIWECKFWSSPNSHGVAVGGIQTAGQEILIKENLGLRSIKNRNIVHFMENRYIIHKCTDPADLTVFMSALNCAKWKEAHK